MARLHTGKVVPQTVPDEDFILDYLGDSVLDDFELLSVGFKQTSSAESVPASEKQTALPPWRTKRRAAIFCGGDLPELRFADVMPVVDVR